MLPTYPNLFFLALKMDMQAFEIQLQNHNEKQVISNQGNNKDHIWFYLYQWLFGVLRLLKWWSLIGVRWQYSIIMIAALVCIMKAHGLPDNTFTFWVTAISLIYSSDGQLIISAFARRISTLVDNTSYLHLSGIICFPQNKQKPKSDYKYSCIFMV